MQAIKEWSRSKLAAVTLGTLTVAAGIALLTVALWPENAATAKKNYCNSLSSLSSTVLNYQGLDPRTATNE